MLNHRTASQQRAHGFLSAAWPEENCAFIDFTGDNDLPAFQAQASIIFSGFFSGFGLTGQSHLAQQLAEGFAFLGEHPALGIQVEFISYPQQTPQGKAIREWIVTHIRPSDPLAAWACSGLWVEWIRQARRRTRDNRSDSRKG